MWDEYGNYHMTFLEKVMYVVVTIGFFATFVGLGYLIIDIAR